MGRRASSAPHRRDSEHVCVDANFAPSCATACRQTDTDIRDAPAIRNAASLHLPGDLLPSKVGSLLSVNALREDLEVSHRTVSTWLDILEAFYYQFRIYPHQERKVRSLRKEPKLYQVDWSEVPQPGARFENLVACHLLKYVQYLYEHEGYRAQLSFLRNVDKKEVDFLVTVDQRPWFCVEAKYQGQTISDHLGYFRERLNIPYAFQVIRTPGIDFVRQRLRPISADRSLAALI